MCGCVAFRIDEYAADSATSDVDTAAAAAAAAPPSANAAQLSILLVRSKKKDEWIFPKGGWEQVSNRRSSEANCVARRMELGPADLRAANSCIEFTPSDRSCVVALCCALLQFESAAECATRECLEEAGAEGVVLCELPSVDFASKKGKRSRMHPFLLQVTQLHRHWAEEGERKRRWVLMADMEATLLRAETRSTWLEARKQLQTLGFIDQRGQAVYKAPPSTASTTVQAQTQTQTQRLPETAATNGAEQPHLHEAAATPDTLAQSNIPCTSAVATAART